MSSTRESQPLSRRRLLQAAGAAGVGVALGGLVPSAGVAQAQDSPLTFGVGPFDRALSTVSRNGYRVRAAGLAVNDQGDILVDGTDRTRRVLYRYADRVGPYVDYLGAVAEERVRGRNVSYDRLWRVRDPFYIYTAPVPRERYYGLRRRFEVNEQFGFGLFPTVGPGAVPGRVWPAPGDFWGLAYLVDTHNVGQVWFIASTAEYRTISPYGTTHAVRTEVVAVRGGVGPSWLSYEAQEAVLSVPLLQGRDEFFRYS
jgi:hypothetical protein